ncbi:MAG: hypothetical protein JWP87_4748 [Labilithrix sp.]|nr:hypothetical protein [Labilithrix sp.]
MTPPARPLGLVTLVSLVSFGLVGALVVCASGCNDKKPQGAGIVVDAGSATPPPAEAGTVDVTQCAGCQLAPTPAWTFEGVYRDPQCTEPLAQLTAPACTVVPALGSTNLTYVDEVGLRKANENATVTLAEQIAPEALRYRKAGKDGKACVRANEGAVDVTPMGCANNRACRDQAGALTCTTCRTFASGCPDFEETRLYATINDPGLKTAKPSNAGGGNVARLAQCCAQLAAEGKRLGASPEGGMLVAAAAQCTQIVNAAGPNGTAPELGALRAALAGRNLPAVCAGF